MRSSHTAILALLTCSAALHLFAAQPAALTPVATNDPQIIRRWALDGDPHGIAVGADGTLYVGLAQPQAIVAIDPKSGAIRKRVVLDSAEIASTKELVTLRTNRDRSRLYVANGSDESATILTLPDLHVTREITLEGETIRDVVPDPKNRYIYVLGRRVHVFDANGERELHTLPDNEPAAIAASSSTLAVAKGPVIARYDTTTFKEQPRVSITDAGLLRWLAIKESDVIIAMSYNALVEVVAPLQVDPICLPERSGPQIATLNGDTLLFVERRCNSSMPLTTTTRSITPASLYGVTAYAIAYDAASNTLAATDRAGFLTIYKVPRAVVAR